MEDYKTETNWFEQDDAIHTTSNNIIQYTARYKSHAEGPIPHKYIHKYIVEDEVTYCSCTWIMLYTCLESVVHLLFLAGRAARKYLDRADSPEYIL